MPAPGNTTGVREYALSWTDTNGNLWLFGGTVSTGTQENNLNDLWKFDPTTSEWSWVSGSSSVGTNCPVLGGLPVPNCGRSGIYGTLGTPATGNTPGGRYQAASWVDSSGNFWLYGGLGFDGAGNWGALSDLWRFTPSTTQWTWMGGSSALPVTGCYGCVLGQPSVFGTLGVPAQGNTPGGLSEAATWSGKNGNLWLFSGTGYTPNGGPALSNDLWEFNTAINQWAWMGGNSNFGSLAVYGTYGILGQPASGNFPGWRVAEATWTDDSGDFWLFGGQGYAASGAQGLLNDLWEFNPSTNQWAWEGGSSTLNCANGPPGYCDQPGVYGTLGVPAAGNNPGSRISPFNWKDGNGNLWLFGGVGIDATSNLNDLNDLWEFSPAKKEWVWVGGNSTVGSGPAAGVYGSLGTPGPSNQPGGRAGGADWTDTAGNLWLLGGYGFDAHGSPGYLNDLWVYQLSPSFAVSGTPVSIAAGAMTGNTSTITVTPTGGFTGTVTLTSSLTSSPSAVTAPPTLSFNATNLLVLSSTAAATGTLTIATTASSTKSCTSFNDAPGRGSWYVGSGAVLASLLLFVIPRRSRAWRSIFSLLLSFVALAGGLVACSSGGGAGVTCPGTLIPGTTTGNYIISVTATSGAITKTAAVTVTVQ